MIWTLNSESQPLNLKLWTPQHELDAPRTSFQNRFGGNRSLVKLDTPLRTSSPKSLFECSKSLLLLTYHPLISAVRHFNFLLKRFEIPGPVDAFTGGVHWLSSLGPFTCGRFRQHFVHTTCNRKRTNFYMHDVRASVLGIFLKGRSFLVSKGADFRMEMLFEWRCFSLPL